MSLPVKTILWGGSAVIVLVGGGRIAFGLWRYIALRKARLRQIEEWTALAQPRGFEVDARGEEVALRGTVASRSFVVDGMNFFGYGMDTENAMHFDVEDPEARFSISGLKDNLFYGLEQPPTGDEAFDARRHVRANTEGLRYLARLGPDERRLLVDFPELEVFQGKGKALIRLPYTLDAAYLDAVCRFVTQFWGPPG